jgi:PleD family two-component response regulator
MSNKKPFFFLAENDDDDQMLFIEALKKIDASIKCEIAFNGEEAICKLKELREDPDYIFLDINMPIMNGLECLSELKKMVRFKNIPVIVYSTLFSNKDMERSHSLGAYDIFKKPYSIIDLSAYLMKLL